MARQILRKYTFFILSIFHFIWGQISDFKIKEYFPLPERISELGLKPTKFNWSIGNRFILIDEVKNQIMNVNPIGNLSFPSGLSENSVYGQFIWAGIIPEGIGVVDRLENSINYLDVRLNTNSVLYFSQKMYPEMAAVNSLGVIYLFSQTYNSIYTVERSHFNSSPFIDFTKERLSSNCFIDMSLNDDSDLFLLGCDGIAYVFSLNGKLKASMPVSINDPKHVIGIGNDWFVFNDHGIALSINTNIKYRLPQSSIPLVDVQSKNSSIAILSLNQILILDVK
tara:strand:+ start:497 stop:1339 length:843 start_codon:yes stop_codon:yes gene_type:complete